MEFEHEGVAAFPSTAARGPLRLSHVAAVAAGNGLEFYDFLVYANFAIYIGRAYFPVHGAVASLLLSLATFGIGFVTRPIGGLVLGRLGDRIGRKPAMLISFALMAVGLLGLAVTPTYAQIGIGAPILAVIFRLIQGFALGGEVGPSTAYLVEAAPTHRRGLMGAMQNTSQGLAMLAASGAGVALSFMMSPSSLASWGWRLAFLLGLLIVPFGLMVRRSLPDTPAHLTAPAPQAGAARIPWRLVALSVLILASGTINTYVNTYMVTFAMDTLHLPARSAFSVGLVNGATVAVFGTLGGWLSDRFGRRTVMIPAACIGVALTLPAYWLLIAHPSAVVLDLAMASVMIPTAVAGGVMLVAITESFPFRMRCLAVGLIYATAIAVFGGTTQFMVGWLIHAFGQPLVPAYYRMMASVIGILAMVSLPESAPAKLSPMPGALLAGAA